MQTLGPSTPEKEQPPQERKLHQNGRRGKADALEFGCGEASSYVKIPPIPSLHFLIQSFQMELWLKTDRTDVPMTVFAIVDHENYCSTLSIMCNWSLRTAIPRAPSAVPRPVLKFFPKEEGQPPPPLGTPPPDQRDHRGEKRTLESWRICCPYRSFLGILITRE